MNQDLADLRIVTLNLRHGGGRRVDDIAKALLAHDADVLVLTEFRTSSAGLHLCEVLRGAGFAHQRHSAPPARVNGVLIASRLPLEGREVHLASKHRAVEALVGDISIVGVYFPGTPAAIPKFWEDEFMAVARQRVDDRALFIGDFNSGKHLIDELGSTFTSHRHVCEMEAAGWTDAWRSRHATEREFTWLSHRQNGFRLDHAWLSPSLKNALVAARHSHAERTSRVSDHSALVLELARGKDQVARR